MKKYFYVLFAFLLAFGLAAGAVGQVSAATVCVDPANTPTCYATIQEAVVAAADGDTITVVAGTYNETGQIVIDKNLSIVGENKTTTIITPAGDTGSSGDTRGWFLVTAGKTFNLSNVTLDGEGRAINMGVMAYGPGIYENNIFQNLGAPGYQGRGVAFFNTSNVTVRNNTLSNIGRIGIYFRNTTNVVIDGNTYTGKGDGDWLDYGIELEQGSVAEIMNNTISNCTGVASDGSTSAGMMMTTYFGPGATANLHDNTFQDNSAGIAVGYDGTDTSSCTATGNTFTGNDFAITSTNPVVNAGNNWFGTNDGSTILANLDGNVDFGPWCSDAACSTTQAFSPGMTIQSAIDSAVSGTTIILPAGEYTESFTINKHVKLVGAGSGSDSGSNTVLKMSAGPAAVTITGSGASDVDPVLFQDLRVSLTGGYGFYVPGLASVSYLKMDNVNVACGPDTYSENEAGFWVWNTASLRHFTVIDSSFNQCDFGWYFQKHDDWGPGGSMVEFVDVQNTLFSGNSYKGFYAEKLSEASFTNVTVENTATTSGVYFNIPWNAGIDINLKGQETYQNLVFTNLTVTGNGVGSKEGVGLAIKARSDGPTYGAHPATLNNVQINGGTFTGNERGIRIGEPGKNNPGPTGVVITGATIQNNLKTYSGSDGSAYGDVVNLSTAPVTLFGNTIPGGGVYISTPDTVYVDDDWSALAPFADPDGAGPATSFGYDAFASIQTAVDRTNSGGMVEVAVGTYTEQVTITKSLTLVGENRDTTIINAPATIPVAADPNSYVVKIAGSGVDVELSGFTVSGPGPTGCGSIGYGIVVRDGAHANIHDNKVLDIRDNPFSGCQNGVGIVVGRSAWSTTGTAEITDNIIAGFQKNGIVVSNTGSSATISGNTVTGAGPTTVIAQNGIQVSSGANATIEDNTVEDISWTLNASWVSAGMLLYDAGTVNMSGNTITDVQAAIYSILTDGTFDNNTITTTSAGVGNPPAGVYGLAIEGGVVTASNNTITDNGTAGGYGLVVYAGYDGDANTNVTLTGNTVSGWNTGVSFDQCESGCGTGEFTGIEFEFNEITGNTTQVENLNVTPAVPASPNWWGSSANPGFDLDEFSFSPWCADQACTTFGYLASDVQDALDDLAPDSTFTLISGVYDQLVLSVPGTTLELLDGAEIRPSAGPCFLINADNVSIEAETPAGAICVPPTFYDGLDLLKAVNGLRVVNMEFDGSAVNTLDGLNLGSGLTNFQFLNNYIHGFGRDGVRFTPISSPSGSMVMVGNLFAKNSGFGVNNLTPVSLTTTFNNWFDPKGPKGTYGDGYNGKQTYSPYVYADLLATSSGTTYANKVTTTGTITYAVKVSAANVYGAQFDLEFDPSKLELLSITDSGKMAHDAVCPIDTLADAQDGDISYCGKGKQLNGTVTLYTLKFKVKPGTLAGSTTLDFVDDSVSFASSSTLASNFIYPGSMADVTVSIYDPASTTFNLSAQILLEGRSDSSETCMNLGSGIVKCMTDKWGNLTLDNMPAGSYVVKVSKLGYIDLPATLNKTLVVNAGKTSVGKLTLVAGDVDNNEVINLADAVAVANDWGHSGGAIVNPLADINADGKVDLLDLAIVAKNYNKTSAAYKSWKP